MFKIEGIVMFTLSALKADSAVAEYHPSQHTHTFGFSEMLLVLGSSLPLHEINRYEPV